MDTETKERLKDSKLGSRVSGAEGLVLSLLEEGADTLFGYPVVQLCLCMMPCINMKDR